VERRSAMVRVRVRQLLTLLRVVVLVLLMVVPALGPGATGVLAAPGPEELCAPLVGTPSYEDCVSGAQQALDPSTVVTSGAGEPAATTRPDGLALSEESLRQQRQVLWVIVGVVLLLVFVLVALSWWRAMKKIRRMFSPETLALMEQLIPPEVRAERPDVTVGDGLTDKERALLRGQRNLIIFLLVLPASVFVLLQVWQPSVDTSMTIGEVARYGPLVLAIPALIWTRRRVRKAMEAGDDRWSVLGLHMESTPNAVILPRGLGGIRATASGASVLSGRRFGRDVRIEMDAGSLRTGVAIPAGVERAPTDEPGSGAATLWGTGGWLLLDRNGVSVIGPSGMETMLRDLQRVEREADSLVVS
jgi:hypothetical protein